MVTNITNYARSGLADWFLQRLSALVLGAYTLFLLGYLLFQGDLQFQQWQALFACTGMRIFTLAALLSLLAHAWIGMWTIATDYLNERALGRAAVWVRLLFQLGCGVALFAYVVWGVQTLWGL